MRDGTIVEAQRACALGVEWFGDGHVPARVLVDRRDASLSDAIDAAAQLLKTARRPLIFLAPDITCEAQREAIALADRLRAVLDTVTSSTATMSILAAQELGRASATLGEIRNRADVIVFWGVNPEVRYPRYRSRYAPVPRTVIAVDVGDDRGPEDADVRLTISKDDEVAVLTALATSGRLKAAPTNDLVGAAFRRPDVWSRADEIGSLLFGGRYLVFVADGEPQNGRDPGRTAALIALTQALNGQTRCAFSVLRGGGNRSGADACLTSQTGYPAAVDFSRGHPRYRPFDGTAHARLARAEIDAVLVIGSVARVSDELAMALSAVPHAVIGPGASQSALAGGHVVVDTGVAAIHEEGTVLRMDDVPLPARKCIDGPADAVSVLRALREVAR